jgi:glyoxylase-like metal-dependent hydrolase (beta-lactamase superfamily II)
VYRPIKTKDNIDLSFMDSRVFLQTLAMKGEIISTPGHSPDHVTLVLDEGIAFTGDLPSKNCVSGESEVFKDWQRLGAMNVTKVYPAHGLYDLPLRH